MTNETNETTTQNTYIKCPRCELNYILKKDKYCDVCKMEMKAGCLEENEYNEFEDDMELCPVCKTNYINEGESMCSTCMEENMSMSTSDEDVDWRTLIDKTDEDEDLDLLPVENDDIDEELGNAFAKDLDDDFADDDLDDMNSEMYDDFDDFDDLGSLEDFDDDDEDDDENDDDDYDDDDYDDYDDDDKKRR